MWFKEPDIYVRRPPQNKRRPSRDQLLMVNARMGEQRRARIHKIGGITLGLIALVGTLWAVMVGVKQLTRLLFTENPQFTLRQLELRSDGKLKDRHIREYGHLAEGANLFALDIRQIRADLESVPVVDRVEVRRQLPDKLVVEVKERIAIARLGSDDHRHYLAIDREGHVLGPSSRSPDLPAITGLRDRGLRPGSYLDQELVRDALLVLDLCDTTRVGETVRIASIDVRHPEYLDIRMKGGERVWFGRQRLEWRLGQLAQVLQEASQMSRAIETADLTVDRNFPVQFR